jgi:hypothetical protein
MQVINVTTPILSPCSISLLSTNPIVDGEVITAIKDASVTYTYEKYSWGLKFNFSGVGTIQSLSVMANALTISKGVNITVSNNEAVLLNGITIKHIEGNFIQSVDYATALANIILADVSTEIYDADVDYIGNIAISINDPIVLNDNITPTDKYRVKRHTLYWDGSLSGTAKLNT